MGVASALFQQIVVMFALMALGLGLFKTGAISEATSKDLGKVLLNAVLPVVIIQSFWTEYSDERAAILGLTFVLSLASLALAIVISRIAFGKDAIAEFSAEFSNAGFIGIPLVRATLGSGAVFFITCYIAELNILQWTYGKYRLSGSAECIQPKAILTSPMLISFAIGLALFFLRVPTPEIATTIMTSISNLNSPLAMIILGVYLAQSDLRSLVLTPRLYVVSVVRLLVVPLATMALLALIPCDATIKYALLITASAPTGSNVAIFCHQLGCDHRYASNIVCITTLLSLASMPIVVSLAGLVF